MDTKVPDGFAQEFMTLRRTVKDGTELRPAQDAVSPRQRIAQHDAGGVGVRWARGARPVTSRSRPSR